MRGGMARIALGCVLIAAHMGSVAGFSAAGRMPLARAQHRRCAAGLGVRAAGSSGQAAGMRELTRHTGGAQGRRAATRARLSMVGAAPAAAGEGPAEPNATVTLTPDGLKTKANMNAYRKIFHACSGVALACTYDLFLTRAQAAAVFGASFVVLTIIEVLRLRYAQNAISKFLFARFRKIARDYETDQVACARPALVSCAGVPGPSVAVLHVDTHSWLSRARAHAAPGGRVDAACAPVQTVRWALPRNAPALNHTWTWPGRRTAARPAARAEARSAVAYAH
jgi:hypothetical protein